MIRRKFRVQEFMDRYPEDDDGELAESEPEVTNDLTEANLITSEVDDEFLEFRKEPVHAPVLDIDFEVSVVPSTTPGHYHLYLERLVPHSKYMALLGALAEAGLIEVGYAEACKNQGYTAVRPPWVLKES